MQKKQKIHQWNQTHTILVHQSMRIEDDVGPSAVFAS
jgi:hypothetical protein